MYILNDQQVDFIAADIRGRGIHLPGLQDSLLDHICILLEQRLEREEDFKAVYTSIIQLFYKTELKEIEEQTLFLLNYRHHVVIGRPLFFTVLFILVIGPFASIDIAWLMNAYPQSGWHIPREVWGPSIVYALFPLLILLVLLLTPDRLDPLIPRKSRILLGTRPLIKIVPTA